MKRVQKALEQAEYTCQNKGARLTEKRKLVLAALLISDKALSAYELVEVCKREFGKTLPAMSVYRILDFLQSEQMAHKLSLANKYVACSSVVCEHSEEILQFLICTHCSKVKEVHLGELSEADLRNGVERAGFHLETPQLEISCICDDCIDKHPTSANVDGTTYGLV